MSPSVASTFSTSLSVAVRWMVSEVRRLRQLRLDTHCSTSLLLHETAKDLNPVQERRVTEEHRWMMISFAPGRKAGQRKIYQCMQ